MSSKTPSTRLTAARSHNMKNLFTAVFLFVLAVDAHADCIKDQNGHVVCGQGQCEADRLNKIYCANPGGGALKDQFGNVQCGAGYCANDRFGQVWCSKKPGGGAALDIYGNVKCLGGCEPGTPARCEEAQP